MQTSVKSHIQYLTGSRCGSPHDLHMGRLRETNSPPVFYLDQTRPYLPPVARLRKRRMAADQRAADPDGRNGTTASQDPLVDPPSRSSFQTADAVSPVEGQARLPRLSLFASSRAKRGF